MEKHVAGFKLKSQGADHSEIAKALHVSANTVTAWSKKHKWAQKLENKETFQETSLDTVRDLISHNLQVLKVMKDKLLLEKGELEKLEVSQLKTMLTSKGDIDALNKLFVNIRGDELKWDNIVKTIRLFTEYLEYENHELAMQIADYANDFIDKKRGTL